jgi:hypothetical protein
MVRDETMIRTEKLARGFARDMGHALGRFASDPEYPSRRDAFCLKCGRHLEYRIGPMAAASLRGQVLTTVCPGAGGVDLMRSRMSADLRRAARTALKGAEGDSNDQPGRAETPRG